MSKRKYKPPKQPKGRIGKFTASHKTLTEFVFLLLIGVFICFGVVGGVRYLQYRDKKGYSDASPVNSTEIPQSGQRVPESKPLDEEVNISASGITTNIPTVIPPNLCDSHAAAAADAQGLSEREVASNNNQKKLNELYEYYSIGDGDGIFLGPAYDQAVLNENNRYKSEVAGIDARNNAARRAANCPVF